MNYKSIYSNSWSYLDARGIAKYRKITTIIRYLTFFNTNKLTSEAQLKAYSIDSISFCVLTFYIYIYIKFMRIRAKKKMLIPICILPFSFLISLLHDTFLHIITTTFHLRNAICNLMHHVIRF
jgi:hypothetical protein